MEKYVIIKNILKQEFLKIFHLILNSREIFKTPETCYKKSAINKNKKIKRKKNYNIIGNKSFLYQKNKLDIKSLIFLIFIILYPILLSKKSQRNLNSNNEITLIVKGEGQYKSFLADDIEKPNNVIINEISQDRAIIGYVFTEPENTVILSWNSPLTSCENMFYNFDAILSIDFSKFDSSKVTNMNNMFYHCINLKSVIFNNFNASLVADMGNMFFGCISLISLDLSNFDTLLVTNMVNMFNNCTSLVSLDLSSFKTNSLQNLQNTFYNDYSLISLDLSNFNISSLLILKNTFVFCKSLIYLNLNSFSESNYIEFNNFISDEMANLIYCIDENKAPRISSYIKTLNVNNDCNNTCFSKSRKIIIEKKKCIDECTNDDTYIYEYNNICYNSKKETPFDNISETLENNDNTDYIIKTESEDNTENKEISQFIEIFEKSDENENYKNTQEIEEDKYTNIIENNGNTDEIKDENISYKIEEDNSKNIDKNENNKENEVNKEKEKEDERNNTVLVVENSDKIDENIKNNNYDMENTSKIIQNYTLKNYILESQEIFSDIILIKDEIIKNFKQDLINGNLDSLLGNITDGMKQDIIIQDKDIIYQITTSENQKNNKNDNISTINLEECENILKEIYHINKNLSLIILKIDYYITGLRIPIIGYEVFHPINKTKLDLNYCKDNHIKLNIPVSIEEDKLFKHDPNSDYYIDKCYTYTTENGTDILLSDRQNEYIENNYSLCENNCTFTGYNKNTKKALCECETKLEIGLISEIIENGNILSNYFNVTDNSTLNIVAMECVNTLFSKNGLLKNIGSYLLLFTFIFYVISIFIFYKCGYHIIDNKIKEIMNLKNKNKINLLGKRYKKVIKKRKKMKKNSLKNSNPIKKYQKKKSKNKDKEIAKHNLSCSNMKIKSIDIKFSLKKDRGNRINIFKKMKINQNNNFDIIKYKDCELNSFDFKMAIKYDKRTFFKYYLSLLLSKHVILFSFYPIDDYNIKIIKVSLFFLSFDLYFAVNTLFFNHPEIHHIYKKGGIYNISYFILNILYSFIISYSFITLIRYYSLSERYLIKIKNEKNLFKVNDMVQSTKRCLIIKYIVFYALSFIFLLFLWFYLSSFCAIFQNCQIIIIKNTFMSFGISVFLPFIYNLFSSIIRIYSLKNSSECVYKFSKIIQLV